MPIDYSKLRNITAREIVSALSRDGFYLRSHRRVRLFIIFWNGFGKPQRAQRTQRKQQLSVPFVSSVVNLLRYNPTHPEEIKKHMGVTKDIIIPLKHQNRPSGEKR